MPARRFKPTESDDVGPLAEADLMDLGTIEADRLP